MGDLDDLGARREFVAATRGDQMWLFVADFAVFVCR